jgi:hypothetical protein
MSQTWFFEEVGLSGSQTTYLKEDEIESIQSARRHNETPEYLVKWKGHDETYNTWMHAGI